MRITPNPSLDAKNKCFETQRHSEPCRGEIDLSSVSISDISSLLLSDKQMNIIRDTLRYQSKIAELKEPLCEGMRELVCRDPLVMKSRIMTQTGLTTTLLNVLQKIDKWLEENKREKFSRNQDSDKCEFGPNISDSYYAPLRRLGMIDLAGLRMKSTGRTTPYYSLTNFGKETLSLIALAHERIDQ